MQYNKVEICGINTNDIKVLKESEKIELLKKARQGDKKAREELIKGNLRLVLSVIQRFQNRGESMDDLFQVGVIGLIKAIDNFNLDLDVKFSTYAVPMCIGEVRRYLRDDNPIRVSRSMRDTAYKAMQVLSSVLPEGSSRPKISKFGGVYVAEWTKPDSVKVSAIWSPFKTKTNLSFDGNAKSVVDFMGKSYPASIPEYVSASPFYIEGVSNARPKD